MPAKKTVSPKSRTPRKKTTRSQTPKKRTAPSSARKGGKAKPKKKAPSKVDSAGGQAVIDGVMMRAAHAYAVALLRRDRSISVKVFPHRAYKERHPLFAVPVVRGFVSLIESLVIGYSSLDYSMRENEEYQKEMAEKAKRGHASPAWRETLGSVLTFAFSFSLAIALFLLLPYFFSKMLLPLLINQASSPILFNLIAGSLRLLFFFLYIVAISFLPDIKELFRFHGAEHKTIWTYEQKKPLTVKNTRSFSTHHPRCGTSFLLIVAVLTIAFYIIFDSIFSVAVIDYHELLGYLFIHQGWHNALSNPFLTGLGGAILRVAVHLPFIPLIAGLSYEVLRFSSRWSSHPAVKVLTAPGLLLQRITTQPPNDDQIKTAIAALKALLKSS